MTNALDLTEKVHADSMVLAVMDRSRTVTRQVVVKDDDLAEAKEKHHEVQKAMLKELRTWADLKCFSRKPKKFARKIIDVRWVHKRKWEKPKTDGKQAASGTSIGEACSQKQGQ